MIDVRHCFSAERNVLDAIAACKTPDAGALGLLLMPVGELIMKCGAKADGRRTDAFNHLKAMAEAVQALSFVAFQAWMAQFPIYNPTIPLPFQLKN